MEFNAVASLRRDLRNDLPRSYIAAVPPPEDVTFGGTRFGS